VKFWHLISLALESLIIKKSLGIACITDRVTLRAVVFYWQILSSLTFPVVLCLCFLQPYDVFFYFFQVSQSEGIRVSLHGKTQRFRFLNVDTCIGDIQHRASVEYVLQDHPS
jgi:hypothetical protein